MGAKTVAGVRSIHIPDILIEQLKKERKVVVAYKLKQGSNFNDYDLVVCTRYDNPLDSATLSKRLKAQSIKLSASSNQISRFKTYTRNDVDKTKR